MSEKIPSGNCHCGNQGRSGSANLEKLVMAKVPQDFNANFRIRLVPARDLDLSAEREERCRPRGQRKGWTVGPPTLDGKLIATLNKADATMITWLAKDPTNARRFLSAPVAAMREAGVELSRAEAKALSRANEAAQAARVVGPGVRVASLVAEAYPNGRIGRLKPRPDADGDDEPFGCEPRKKG
jgi:hypothetical protein